MGRRLSGLVAAAVIAAATPARAQTTVGEAPTPTRVGLGDVGRSAAAHAGVAALRARLEGRPGLTLPRDAARAALEEPIPASGAAELAARPRATQLLREAREAYSRFDYDGALERLGQLELALGTAPPVPDVTALLVDVNLLAGVVHADRGDAARALDAFRAVRRLAPSLTALDPGGYRPKVVALYAAAGATPETRTARLDVVTEPAGAEVWIDGTRAGTAPLSETLVVGVHYVGVAAPGDVPRLERSTLRPGEGTRLSLLLSRSPPEDRVRQARAGLLAGSLGWDRGPAVIATSASLDLVVVVRDRAGGPASAPATAEAALYDARGGTLGPWMPIAPLDPVLVALATALAAPPPATAALVGGRDRDRSPAAAAPWYRSWWLAPPLLAVGAAVGLGTLWIIERDRTTTYALNRWCFNNTCSP